MALVGMLICGMMSGGALVYLVLTGMYDLTERRRPLDPKEKESD